MDYKGTLTIAIKRPSDSEELMVAVSDTGHGMSEEVKAEIFAPFFTTKRAGEGSGLGLDIVKKIIDKHQGRIEVESEIGRGTTFRIFLPVV
jgi:signal transduction histidine kinase